MATLGLGGMLLLFVHAYSLGGGTYTGIEAVSNGLPDHARAAGADRQAHDALHGDLAGVHRRRACCSATCSGTSRRVPGKTMNAVLVERVAGGPVAGRPCSSSSRSFSEGALLVVAAQAGFLDGPRVLANMAVDSWVPRRFAALSDRLTTQNGDRPHGRRRRLAPALHPRRRAPDRRHVQHQRLPDLLALHAGDDLLAPRGARKRPRRLRQAMLFVVGTILCATILSVTVVEKFREGGWITLAVTGSLVLLCFLIRRHYGRVQIALERLYASLGHLPPSPELPPGEPDPTRPTAVVLVGGYGGLGIHTTLNVFRVFPGHFHNLVFVSVGVVDSGKFKGKDAVQSLRGNTEGAMRSYVELARSLGIPATYRLAVGTDVLEEAERLCLEVVREFPRSTFFAGKVIFRRDRWYERLLHNETAFGLQKRLQWAGHTMVIIPARI